MIIKTPLFYLLSASAGLVMIVTGLLAVSQNHAQADQQSTAPEPVRLPQLAAPRGGESWTAGSAGMITWDPAGLSGSVDLRLWDGRRGLWQTIARDVAVSDGRYVWQVPPGMSGDLFRIRISSQGDPVNYIMSRDFFEIRSAGVAASVVSSARQVAVQHTISVRPMPARERFVVTWSSADSPRVITLVDEQGTVTRRYTDIAGSEYQIDVSDVPSGVYFLLSEFAGSDRVSSKIVVSR